MTAGGDCCCCCCDDGDGGGGGGTARTIAAGAVDSASEAAVVSRYPLQKRRTERKEARISNVVGLDIGQFGFIVSYYSTMRPQGERDKDTPP